MGVDRTKYQIHIPLPAKIDPSVTMMTVEEKPDVTYNDIGGSKEQIEKMREVRRATFLEPTQPQALALCCSCAFEPVPSVASSAPHSFDSRFRTQPHLSARLSTQNVPRIS